MFDLDLYKKAEKKHGSIWSDGVDEAAIDKLANDLNVILPSSYKKFLMKFGEGGITGVYFFGIKDEKYSSAFEKTIKFRKRYKINKSWVVIADESNNWQEYILCLDTSRMKDDECPIVKYDYNHSEVDDYKDNFYDLFNYKCEVALYD
ncbi:MAG: SMI1/KNR4 family protein [Clostridiaceae bacterium]|nr:SMI1/KNR4 family protein [Clostridiaceae bacterium]